MALITGLSSLVSTTPRSMAQSGVREGERLAVPIQWQLRTRDQSWAGGPWRLSGIRIERHKCASDFGAGRWERRLGTHVLQQYRVSSLAIVSRGGSRYCRAEYPRVSWAECPTGRRYGFQLLMDCGCIVNNTSVPRCCGWKEPEFAQQYAHRAPPARPIIRCGCHRHSPSTPAQYAL